MESLTGTEKCPNRSLVGWTYSNDSPHKPLGTSGGGQHDFMMTQFAAPVPVPQPAFGEFTIQLTLAGAGCFTADLGFGKFQHSGKLAGGFVIGTPEVAIELDGDGTFELMALALTKEQMANRVRRLTGRELRDFGPAHTAIQWDPGIQRLLLSLWFTSHDRPPADRNLGSDLVDSVVCRLERLAGREIKVPLATHPSAQSWRSMLALLHDDLETPVANHELAAAAGVSEFHFSRLFKKTTGLSPMNYRMRLRIERAQRLLEDRKNLSLSQVAYACGFADQSHFGRHFKRITGRTPLQYRLQS
ncbi:MAG: helix-turn-helix domain-containing protein [Gemmataceae bacterium]